MEGPGYNFLGNKRPKSSIETLLISDQQERVQDLLKRSTLVCGIDFIKAYCRDLVVILGLENLPELIEAILSLEQEIEQLQEKLDEAHGQSLPELGRFYQSLTPLVMRSILSSSKGEVGFEKLYKTWLEAFRVAIEQELYEWQEVLIDKKTSNSTKN